MLQHQHNSSDASVTKQAADTLVFQPDTNHADTIHANAEGAETNADTQEAQWRLIETAALEDAERTAINVPRLRRKLGKRSLLRRAGIDWDKPTPLTQEKFAALLSRLRNPDPAAWRERVLCAWLLGHAPLTADQKREAALELGNVLQNRHAKRRERYNANLRDISRYTIPFAALFTLLVDVHLVNNSYLANQSMHHLMDSLLFQLAGVLVSFCSIGVFWYFLLYPLLFPFITARNIARNSRVRGAAALALGRLRAPEGVEALSPRRSGHQPPRTRPRGACPASVSARAYEPVLRPPWSVRRACLVPAARLQERAPVRLPCPYRTPGSAHPDGAGENRHGRGRAERSESGAGRLDGRRTRSSAADFAGS